LEKELTTWNSELETGTRNLEPGTWDSFQLQHTKTIN